MKKFFLLLVVSCATVAMFLAPDAFAALLAASILFSAFAPLNDE